MEFEETKHGNPIHYRGRIHCLNTCSEAINLDTRLLNEIGLEQRDPTTIRHDNLSAITITRDATYHTCTKHINIYYHYIREKVASNEASITYVTSKDNIADIMMKAIPPDNHSKIKELLGITKENTC